MDIKIILIVSMICTSCGIKIITCQQENVIKYYNEERMIILPQIVEKEKMILGNQFAIHSLDRYENFTSLGKEIFDFLIHLPILDSITLYPRDTSFIAYLDSACFEERVKNDLDIYYYGTYSFQAKVDSHVFLIVNDERKGNLNELDKFKNRYLVLVNVCDRHLASAIVVAHYYQDNFSIENLCSRIYGSKFVFLKEDRSLDLVYQKGRNGKIHDVTSRSKMKLKLRPSGKIVLK